MTFQNALAGKNYLMIINEKTPKDLAINEKINTGKLYKRLEELCIL